MTWDEAQPLINSIDGFLGAQEGEWLFRQVQAIPDSAVVVEIGSLRGRSTACLALGCKGTQKRVIAIDPFVDCRYDLAGAQSYFDVWRGNMERIGVIDRIESLVMDSRQAGALWGQRQTPIHLLFVDGSHLRDDVIADFEDFFPWVVEGGVVAFHDILNNFVGPQEAWERCSGLLINVGMCDSMMFGQKPATNYEGKNGH